MNGVPYENWANEIRSILKERGVTANAAMLEIASGTGALLRLLQPLYPNLHGCDISSEMLNSARSKAIQHLAQADMRNLPFRNGKFKAIFCMHDSVNYLPNEAHLFQHFCEVYRVLAKGGMYLFDASSERNVIKNYHNKEFREHHQGTNLHWSNHYDAETRKITSILRFTQKGKTDEEIHEQVIFIPRVIRKLIHQAGFKLLDEFTDYQKKKKISSGQLLCFLIEKPK